jgi:hypothetical protein
VYADILSADAQTLSVIDDDDDDDVAVVVVCQC